LIGDNALESPVLLLERAQASSLAHLETAVLLAPAIERLARDRVSTNDLTALPTAFRFLQDPNDLLIGESRLPHSSPPRRASASGTVNLRSDL